MRRILILLLAALLLSLPVSAQALYGGQRELGRVELIRAENGTYEARTELKNDSASPVCVLAEADEDAAGTLALTVRQAGRSLPVFEGTLGESRVLLCTLDAQSGAVLSTVFTGEDPPVLLLTAEPLDAAGATDYARLLFYVCLWMALVVFGSYLTIVFAGKIRKKNKE